MKTYQPKHKDIRREWNLVDAKDKILGRMSTRVAHLLMGKSKAKYSRHMDMGDYVVVINAEKIVITGNKATQKLYYRHSGYPGGFKKILFEKLFEKSPEKVIAHAVSGMLPKNKLQKERMKRLRIVSGSENPYKSHFLKKGSKVESK